MIIFAPCLLTLCVAFLSNVDGQPTISPSPTIDGRVGDIVNILCTGVESVNIGLQEREPNGSLVLIETMNNPRLNRTEISATTTQFTLGPLTSDNNSQVISCIESGVSSNSSTINVIFAPAVTARAPPDDIIEMREGDSLSVNLNVIGNPVPSFGWTRDGAALDNTSELSAGFNTLSISNLLRAHAGDYVLALSNSVGDSTESFTINVTYPPVFITDFVTPNTFTCKEKGVDLIVCASSVGVTGSLLCGVTGNPTPTLMATFNDNIQSLTGQDITITSVTTDNAGNYSCTATSTRFNTIIRNFILFVGGPPVPVSAVRYSILDDTILVEWDYDNSANSVPAVYFLISVTLDDATSPVVTRMVSPSERQYSVSKSDLMLPDRTVTITVSVTVRNLLGDSEPVKQIFTSSGVIVSFSYLLSMLLLAMVVLCV